ncbi:hypothetical protein E8E13_011037 [Curvularia kusanoi]|uniref:Uncharacterized protein n=1 Tax=Curvularia kusanoi TaxID=90978 RepID=A0A9P4WE91_CURKU|nr:hypothetical protein E8E13_011037 [Curvularia kusanoi]
MKTTIISTLTLLTSVLALPAPQASGSGPKPATLSLSNDISGASANRPVPANNVPLTFGTLFAGSNLIRGGALKATSLSNVAPGAGPGPRCVVKRPDGAQVGFVDSQKTFLDLDGNKDRAVETDVIAWTVACGL